MIRVIKIERRTIALALLALAGVVFCVLGFGGIAARVAAWRGETPAATTTDAGGELQTGKAIGGGTPVQYTSPGDPGTGAAPDTVLGGNDAYFVEYRMERERARGMEMETMREVLASPDTDEEVRKTAQERLLKLSNSISREMELENLIRARGFSDAAVFLDGQTVTVVVQEGDRPATEDDHAGIVDMVAKNTGVASENIIVITKN